MSPSSWDQPGDTPVTAAPASTYFERACLNGLLHARPYAVLVSLVGYNNRAKIFHDDYKKATIRNCIKIVCVIYNMFRNLTKKSDGLSYIELHLVVNVV